MIEMQKHEDGHRSFVADEEAQAVAKRNLEALEVRKARWRNRLDNTDYQIREAMVRGARKRLNSPFLALESMLTK